MLKKIRDWFRKSTPIEVQRTHTIKEWHPGRYLHETNFCMACGKISNISERISSVTVRWNGGDVHETYVHRHCRTYNAKLKLHQYGYRAYDKNSYYAPHVLEKE